jgi:transposase
MIKRYIDEGVKKIAVGDLSDIREDNSGGPCGGSQGTRDFTDGRRSTPKQCWSKHKY